MLGWVDLNLKQNNMDNQNRRLIGIIIILVGIMFFLDQLGIGRIYSVGNIIGTFWPVLLIALGLSALSNRNTKVGFLLIGLGVVFQVSELYGWGFWASLWPLAIIAVGVLMLMRRPQLPPIPSPPTTINSSVINETVAFWGSDKRLMSDGFRGGSINTLFGGSNIDLRGIHVDAQGAQLNVFCAFGGVEILVSDNYRVESYGTGILGAWENQFKPTTDPTKPILKINGTVAFGGVEVKN